MVDDGLEAAKAALRKKAHARRAGLAPEIRDAAAVAASAHFLRAIRLNPSDSVAGYWRIRDEMDCMPVLSALRERAVDVALPVVMGAGLPLVFRRWAEDAQLVDAGFGTRAPAGDAETVVPDVIVVPLLGFDLAGTRLGYGGGYYDRTIANLSPKPKLVGLGYACQQLDHIPRENHDIGLDAIVTEEGARFFGATA